MSKLSELIVENISKPQFQKDEKVSFIAMADVSEDGDLKSYTIKSISEIRQGFTYFSQNDILIAKITPCFENGKGCFLYKMPTTNGFGSTEFIVLRAKEDSCPSFIFQISRLEKFRLKMKSLMTGSAGQQRISIKDIKDYEIDLKPNFKEQQKIAQILTTCDTVIEQTQAAIEKYKAIKQGVLHDLFTRGLTAGGQLRPTPQQAPELYKHSELGLIPKEWEVKRLEEIAFVNPRNKDLPNEFIYIDLDSVESGKLLKENLIKKKDAPSRAQRIVVQGDVLYQMVRPYQKNNLYFTLEIDKIKYVASTGYAQLRAFGSPDFLYYQLHTDNFVNRVLCKCTGSNYPAINSSELAAIKVLCPSSTEQNHIALKLKSIDTKLQSEESLLSKYQSIKKGLMSDLLSGKKPLTPKGE